MVHNQKQTELNPEGKTYCIYLYAPTTLHVIDLFIAEAMVGRNHHRWLFSLPTHPTDLLPFMLHFNILSDGINMHLFTIVYTIAWRKKCMLVSKERKGWDWWWMGNLDNKGPFYQTVNVAGTMDWTSYVLNYYKVCHCSCCLIAPHAAVWNLHRFYMTT